MDALILSCSTGGGHNAAGFAIKEELERRGCRVDMMDPYSLSSEKLGQQVGSVYVNLVQKSPRLFGLVYTLGEEYRKLPIRSPVYGVNMMMAERMRQFLEEHHYDVVFMPHLYPAEILTRMKVKGVPVPRMIFIATDYTCIPFTEETRCDYYITPSPRLEEDFTSKGIDPARLRPFGIPVRRDFSREETREEAARRLELDPGMRYLLLAGGSIGAGKIQETIAFLQDYLARHPDTMLITICGRHPALYQSLRDRYGDHPQMRLLTSTEDMAGYMHVSDVLLSKPGGLTSTEAAVAGIPLIHISPIPGCEQKNASFFSRLGMSLHVGDQEEPLLQALELLRDPERAREMVRRQREEINPLAAEQICDFAQALCSTPQEPVEDTGASTLRQELMNKWQELRQGGEERVYTGLDSLPSGTASDRITPGCVAVEGGAFRGTYAAGVLDALMEADLNFQCTVGVSAGALCGMNYVSGQIGRSARINLRYRHDRRYVSLRDMPDNRGIINFDFLLHQIPEDPFDEDRFLDPRRRFAAVVCNCLTGQAEYMDQDNCPDLYKAVQASASMPYISEPVEIGGMPYLDGGCRVKIPFQWALDQGYEKVIVIRTRHRSFRYRDPKEQPFAFQAYKKYPAFAEAIARTEARYNAQCDALDALERQGRVFVIGPSETWSVGRLEKDMEKLGAWYHLGYEDGTRSISALREYLAR